MAFVIEAGDKWSSAERSPLDRVEDTSERESSTMMQAYTLALAMLADRFETDLLIEKKLAAAVMRTYEVASTTDATASGNAAENIARAAVERLLVLAAPAMHSA